MGIMDGYHGDEMECRGSCGLCDKCEARAEKKADLDLDCQLDSDE